MRIGPALGFILGLPDNVYSMIAVFDLDLVASVEVSAGH